MEKTMAEILRPLVDSLIGPSETLNVRFWDGSLIGPPNAKSSLVLRGPEALRRLLWAPGELGAARAYVSGEVDLEGDIYEFLAVRDTLGAPDRPVEIKVGARRWAQLAFHGRSRGILGLPLAPPPEEARMGGKLHSKARDAAAISHHYDVSNDFYRLVLGESLTYSCAYFETADASLEEAQRAKHDLVSRKLGLKAGMRLLDVGCGWGSMAMHAAEHYGVNAVGITISRRQAELARQARRRGRSLVPGGNPATGLQGCQ